MADKQVSKLDVYNFVRGCLNPSGLFSQLGIVPAAISLLSLVAHAFTFGLSSAINQMVVWYDDFLGVAIGWIGSIFVQPFAYLFGLLGIPISVTGIWKHVFVLMNIYFLRDTFDNLRRKPRDTGRFLVQLSTSVLIVSSSSVLFDAISNTQNTASMQAFTAIIPVIGYLIYDLVERSWMVFYSPHRPDFSIEQRSRFLAYRFYIMRALERFLVGVLVASIAMLALRNQPVSSVEWGVATLLLVTLVQAIYWVSGRASLHYQSFGRHQVEYSVLARLMLYSGTTRLGQLMLGTFVGLLLFLAANAGLKFAGL